MFREENFELCVGDKIKWTRNHFPASNHGMNEKQEKRLNGQYISRAKHDCKIYSKDKEKLFEKLEKSGANITAHEKIRHTEKNIVKFNVIDELFSSNQNINKIENQPVIRRKMRM